MTDRAQPSLTHLTARLRNAITPVLIHLDALSAPDGEVRPGDDSTMLERAEARLQEVEELAAVLGIACRAHAESVSLAAHQDAAPDKVAEPPGDLPPGSALAGA